DDMLSLDLNHFTNVDTDAILNYLMEGKGEWKAGVDTTSTEQIYHPTRSIISDKGKNDGEEEANVKMNDKGEAADDEASEGDEATSHANVVDDVFIPA
ncbi:hypothetical protein J1N35_014537, partial [Gossypium stocksii]